MNKIKFGMKKTLSIILLINLISNPMATLAHSGRTDGNGGHKDNKNVSGLGSYHYHHGYGPHLHPGGVCAYDGGNSGSGSSGSGTSGSTNKTPQPPVESESDKKLKVKNLGNEKGYEHGYAGAADKSSEYTSSYKEDYKVGYTEGFKNGSEKRNAEIDEAKKAGQALGESDGYNNSKRTEFDYSGTFKNEYTQAYETYFKIENDKLNNEMIIGNKASFEKGIKNEVIDLNAISSTFVKEASQNGYDLGKEIRERFMTDVPVIGDKLEAFTEYAKDKDGIQIGIDNIADDSFIAISRKSKRKVVDFVLNMNAIEENGVSTEKANIITNTFLSQEIKDCYKTSREYNKSKSDSEFKITVLKLGNKKYKYLPKYIYLVDEIKNEKVVTSSILSKEPKELKKLKKL